jgi:hypothetical protein
MRRMSGVDGFRKRHQGSDLPVANREKQARYRARQKAAPRYACTGKELNWGRDERRATMNRLCSVAAAVALMFVASPSLAAPVLLEDFGDGLKSLSRTALSFVATN